MAIGSDLRVVLGALAGVGLGGVALLTLLPMLVPIERAAPPPAANPSPAAAPTPPGPAEPDAGPRFDTVRVAPDGSGLVAGRAEPGATVAVMAGEEVAAEVTADEEGAFVAFLELPPSARPRTLSLRDGEGNLSEETVIVAPADMAPGTPGEEPEAVASADVGAAPEPPTPASDPGTPAEAAGSVSRDLPSDQPLPDLALPEGSAVAALGTGGAVPGLLGAPGSGDVAATGTAPAESVAEMALADPGPVLPGVVAMPEAAPSDPTGDGEAPGAGPEIASANPAKGIPPATGEAPEAAPGSVPASPNVAVAGPVPAEPPDMPPESAPVPSVEAGPAALPPPGDTPPPGQAAILLSDAEGVRVLQPALAPGADAEVLSTVALDAISYGDAGEVLLSGRAAGGGSVRLYLDNAAVAEVPVGPDGQWSTTLTGTSPGDYTLRVDQLDAGGEVVSRIETPFRREGRDDLDAVMAEAQEAGQIMAVRTVQPGNTLWAIARDRYGQGIMYVQVFEMNRSRIRDPDLIYPGQVFVLPAREGR